MQQSLGDILKIFFSKLMIIQIWLLDLKWLLYYWIYLMPLYVYYQRYIELSYNLSGLANQNQALRQNTSRYFILKMSVFNTSKVLCNSHVMVVYVIIVHYCWRSLLWRSLLLTFAFIMDELQSTYIWKKLFLLPLIVYSIRYDD